MWLFALLILLSNGKISTSSIPTSTCPLAPVYTSATLHGFDISPALFPSKSTLPTNIHLSVLDARQPISDDLRGIYDLVHIRLIAVGLKPTEWTTVVHENMIAAGLVAVQSDFVSSDRLPETRKAMTENGMLAIFSWARLMTAKKSPGFLTLERLSELERQMKRETYAGAAKYGASKLTTLTSLPDSNSKDLSGHISNSVSP
ncbi:hypothetical protein TSTA_041300 [Talaromyces stipitatus ATCC 10500]|uniref:Uncharacterized protein n=1 Tax=Talaromyces stipitatus (strain ATCC 10500 / CBS 375.48 / QM 6759 / NRRL 1006) TaxID=441959 RepID=B8MJ63_TALSN|nr:uncharacterized protein TSTA_041300 [Talaromyces stipitatus ATCC 10500]EED14652.1 hypothetical protein TSTA_041300 [Talaromyces stipitatus ATCC 10500]